jgi:hypothetical protein
MRLSTLDALHILVALMMGAACADARCDARCLVNGMRLGQAAASARKGGDLERFHHAVRPRPATAIRSDIDRD